MMWAKVATLLCVCVCCWRKLAVRCKRQRIYWFAAAAADSKKLIEVKSDWMPNQPTEWKRQTPVHKIAGTFRRGAFRPILSNFVAAKGPTKSLQPLCTAWNVFITLTLVKKWDICDRGGEGGAKNGSDRIVGSYVRSFLQFGGRFSTTTAEEGQPF